jgi:hypothetical protein
MNDYARTRKVGFANMSCPCVHGTNQGRDQLTVCTMLGDEQRMCTDKQLTADVECGRIRRRLLDTVHIRIATCMGFRVP